MFLFYHNYIWFDVAVQSFNHHWERIGKHLHLIYIDLTSAVKLLVLLRVCWMFKLAIVKHPQYQMI